MFCLVNENLLKPFSFAPWNHLIFFSLSTIQLHYFYHYEPTGLHMWNAIYCVTCKYYTFGWVCKKDNIYYACMICRVWVSVKHFCVSNIHVSLQPAVTLLCMHLILCTCVILIPCCGKRTLNLHIYTTTLPTWLHTPLCFGLAVLQDFTLYCHDCSYTWVPDLHVIPFYILYTVLNWKFKMHCAQQSCTDHEC